jgi:hypothetical protein
MTKSLTKTLAGVLTLCLAWGCLHAAPDTPEAYLSKPIGQLKKIIESGDSEIDRIHAAKAIGDMLKTPAKPKRGKAPTPLRQLNASERKLSLEAAGIGIGDSSCAVRHYSRKTLALLGEDAVPILKAALAGKDINKLQAACLVIYDMGKRRGRSDSSLPAGIDVVAPGVTRALEHDSYVVREAAATACRGLGPIAAAALPQIIKLLGDKEFSVANAAVHAVAAVDPSGEKSVSALTKTLDSPHDLREFICVELGAMGQNAGPAVPALAKIVNVDRNSWHAGKAACNALMAIVAFNPRGSDGKVVKDKVAAVRPIALAAIIDGALNNKSAFRQQDCFNALFIRPHLHCPFGKEAGPLVARVMTNLSQYASEKPTRWGPPLDETCNLAARIAQTNPKMKQELIVLARGLLKNQKTHKSHASRLEKMLKALEG